MLGEFYDDTSSKENQKPLNQLINPKTQLPKRKEESIPLNLRNNNDSQKEPQ